MSGCLWAALAFLGGLVVTAVRWHGERGSPGTGLTTSHTPSSDSLPGNSPQISTSPSTMTNGYPNSFTS